MISPTMYKPIVTREDIMLGSITRYFVKSATRRNITEVSPTQYELFKNNPYYVAVKIPWVITGNLFPSEANGRKILTIEEQNKKIVEFYSKRVPELKRIIKNYIQFASPTINRP